MGIIALELEKRDAEVQELSIIGGSNLWKHLDSFHTARNFPKPFTGVETIYPLDLIKHAKELDFFEKTTGIEDPLVLKGHMLKIREAAYKIYPYPCIWVGVNLKEVVKDGWDANNVLGIDFHQDKSEMIHSIANSFLSNILLETTLNGAPAEEAQQVLDLRNLKDLNPLK
ncbi:hypothetical protein H4Q26_004955 [Puccinia striiformis f. sp. tritici PST-130]|nr:hypothetical protein H4Q26_004955 [Puccinia striiformis f. sp. tritici PST-130]